MSFTRRDFLAGSALALAGSALGSSPLLAWQRGRGQATPVFTPMRRNVGYFTASGGTVGYLIDPGGVVVVDSQFQQTATLLIEGLNERSKGRGVDRLINTHHHGDHTGGNIAFKGIAKRVVAHATAVEHQKNPPGRKPPTTEQLFADTTFTDTWREQIGDEWIRAKYYGPAHTSGDAVITFERANVAHMGDLMFNLRHPVIDKPAGASLKNWASVLDLAAADHESDTMYIFGHSGAGAPVIGGRADLATMRDYLNALLAFVEKEMKSGKTREQVLAAKPTLPGFDKHGPLGAAQVNAAFDELSGGV